MKSEGLLKFKVKNVFCRTNVKDIFFQHVKNKRHNRTLLIMAEVRTEFDRE